MQKKLIDPYNNNNDNANVYNLRNYGNVHYEIYIYIYTYIYIYIYIYKIDI